MPQNDPSELNTQVSASIDRPAQSIDVQGLAEKIVELMKREARLERERTGRH
jgi:hypothetical protein